MTSSIWSNWLPFLGGKKPDEPAQSEQPAAAEGEGEGTPEREDDETEPGDTSSDPSTSYDSPAPRPQTLTQHKLMEVKPLPKPEDTMFYPDSPENPSLYHNEPLPELRVASPSEPSSPATSIITIASAASSLPLSASASSRREKRMSLLSHRDEELATDADYINALDPSIVAVLEGKDVDIVYEDSQDSDASEDEERNSLLAPGPRIKRRKKRSRSTIVLMPAPSPSPRATREGSSPRMAVESDDDSDRESKYLTTTSSSTSTNSSSSASSALLAPSTGASTSTTTSVAASSSTTSSSPQQQPQQQQPPQPLANASSDASVASDADSSAPTQNLEVNTGGLKLTLIDDVLIGRRHAPLANFWLADCRFEVSSWSTSMKAFLQSELSIDYFSQQLEVWEPLVEPWKFQLKFTKEPFNRMTLMSNELVRINITKAMIETVLNTMDSLKIRQQEQQEAERTQASSSSLSSSTSTSTSTSTSSSSAMVRVDSGGELAVSSAATTSAVRSAEYSSGNFHSASNYASLSRNISISTLTRKEEDALQQRLQKKLYPFVICNQTGMTIWYWMNGQGEIALCKLENEKEEPIIPRYIKSNRKLRLEQEVIPVINVQVEGDYTPVTNLPMDKVGVYVTHISPFDKGALLAYEVTYRTGCKVLRVRSNILLKNNCDSPVQVFAVLAERDSVTLDPIPAGGTLTVPVRYASQGILRFRPSDGYRWSDQEFVLSSLVDGDSKIITCGTIHRVASVSFYYSVQIESSQGGKLRTLTLNPILEIENLLPTIMEYRLYNRRLQTPCLPASHLEKGEVKGIHLVDPATPMAITIKIPFFTWCNVADINSKEPDYLLRVQDEQKRSCIIHINNVKMPAGHRRVSFYCQYWMVNQTGLPMLFRRSGLDSSIAAGQFESNIKLTPNPKDWYKNPVSDAPTLFSVPALRIDPRGDLASVKIASSLWSDSISLASQGTSSTIDILDAPAPGRVTRLFQLGMTISAASGKFWRTKIVTFTPRYILINNLGDTVFYMQAKTMNFVGSLDAGEHIPFYWVDSAGDHQLCIRLKEQCWEWSGGFDLHDLGNFQVKMRRRDGLPSYLARVRIKYDGATTLVILNPEDKEFPDYRIDNRTRKAIRVNQKGCQAFDRIPAGESLPYAWDEPSFNPRTLVAQLTSKDMLEVSLDSLQQYPKMRVGSQVLQVEVFAEGPTKVLCLRQVTAATQRHAGPLDWNLLERETSLTLSHIQFSLEGFGLSVVDDTPQEIMYVSIEKVQVDKTTSATETKIEFIVGRVQIDNQLYLTPHPVVLLPSYNDEDPDRSIFFNLALTKSNTTSSIDYFRYLYVAIQEIELMVDEIFLLKLIQFFNYIGDYFKDRAEMEDEEEKVKKYLKYTQGAEDTKWLYFEMLQLHPVKVNLSFANVSAAERDSASTVSRLLSRGGILANIDGAPLYLTGYAMEHPFTSRSDLLDRIAKHYISSAIREFHKVLGSADFLGSPLSFLRTMGTGVHDFIAEPARGLQKSPTEFGVGLLKGTQSLVKNSGYGVFNSVAKLTGTLGKGAAELTFDREYLRERETLNREKAHHIGEGLAYGFRDLGLGIFQGIGGVVYEPVQGAIDDGVLGALKGVARGVAGFGIKPAVGVVDLVTRTAEGIRNTTTYWDEKHRLRVRPPRYFGSDRLLQPYCREKSEGQELLYTLEEGKYQKDYYMYHINIENSVIIISDNHVISINRFNIKLEEWNVQIKDIRGIELFKKGVLIHLRRFHSSSVLESPTDRRVIYTPPIERQKVYTQLLDWLKRLKGSRHQQF